MKKSELIVDAIEEHCAGWDKCQKVIAEGIEAGIVPINEDNPIAWDRENIYRGRDASNLPEP